MKLALFTDEVSQDLEKALRLAVRHGCEGVEIRSVWDTPVPKLSAEQVKEIKALLDSYGLKCAAIASPVFKCELDDPAAQAEHLEFLRRCIGIGQELGTNIIRVFAFWRRGPAEEVWERVKAQFAPAIPIAEAEGALLGIENEPSTYSGTAAEVRRLIEEMDSPAVRAIWDPGNEVHVPDLIPYPDSYRLVAPFMVHMHIKDGVRIPETKVVPVGDGIVDWLGQFAELKRVGYDGYLSMETHWRPQQLTEEQMNKPGGASFSEGGNTRPTCAWKDSPPSSPRPNSHRQNQRPGPTKGLAVTSSDLLFTIL